MTTWDPRANELFLKALKLRTGEERQEHLAVACAGDLALRAEVEALLEASFQAGSFLESPTVWRKLVSTMAFREFGLLIRSRPEVFLPGDRQSWAS